MMQTPNKTSDADDIRRRVLAALARSRTPGFHFPGYLLQIAWPHMDKTSVTETMPDWPPARDAHGRMSLLALGVMIDTALATAPRLQIATGVRQATVQLHAQFTGHPIRGGLEMTAGIEGFSAGSVRQALSRGVLHSAGKPVCHASGTFVVLPPPAGARLAPLPWQPGGAPARHTLDMKELDTGERAVMRACTKAAPADKTRPFVERFWGVLPQSVKDGARCIVRLGPHHGNRVGHVQGGLLWGLAATTACAAVPRHPTLSAISAWFVSPGQGKALRVRSTILHAGRSFAVVRTEIKNADGSRVLEVVSNHAA
ncbi:MAG: PaaI family thioesterase [Burkholderiales bacterium]|nr:PaaI family thioesterase [Burkholderiales bacterium]